MSPADAVARYYDAWISKRGDMSDVPLAADFKFRGPVADFSDAESYRAMAREAGAMITSFTVRRQCAAGRADDERGDPGGGGRPDRARRVEGNGRFHNLVAFNRSGQVQWTVELSPKDPSDRTATIRFLQRIR